MIDCREYIRSKILSDGNLAAIFGQRIYSKINPSETSMPYIYIEMEQDEDRGRFLNGNDWQIDSFWKLNIVATNYSDIINYSTQIYNLFNNVTNESYGSNLIRWIKPNTFIVERVATDDDEFTPMGGVSLTIKIT